MSIAWGSIVILVLLLPGFLFSVGLFAPERFTRETAQRSPLGQLAGVLSISLLVHGLLFLLNRAVCGGWLACIDLNAVLDAIVLEKATGPAPHTVALHLANNAGSIFLYFAISSPRGCRDGVDRGLADRVWKNQCAR